MVLEQQEECGRGDILADLRPDGCESVRLRNIELERVLAHRTQELAQAKDNARRDAEAFGANIDKLCAKLKAQRAELATERERGDRLEREAYEATQRAIAAGSDHETIARLTQERDRAIKALADALEELEAMRGKAEVLERTVRIGRHDHDEDLERCYRLERISDALAVALIAAQR